MGKYKIIKNSEVKYRVRSNDSLEKLKTNPGLYYLCNGEYKVEMCGQNKAFKLISSHFSNIIKLWRKHNV